MKIDIKYLMYRAASRALSPLQLDVIRKSDVQKYQKRTCMERLKLARKNGLSPQVIFDGGAFKGLWSKQAADLFPGAQIIMVEPNPFMQDIIKKNTEHIIPAPILVNAALGETQKKASLNIWFDPDSDSGASLLEHVSGPARQSIRVDVDTIDNIANRFSFIPNILKLDLQGGELAALKGATEVLHNAECAVIEFGCLDAYVHRTTPRGLIDIMYDNDYCLYDVVGLEDRPFDGALTGGDFIFMKNSSSLRAHKGWS
jgi:FkbM family methyltransferase